MFYVIKNVFSSYLYVLEQFSFESQSNHSSQATVANNTTNQSELEVNTRDRRQHGKIKQAMSWFDLVLLLRGWRNGLCCWNQSQNVLKQNQIKVVVDVFFSLNWKVPHSDKTYVVCWQIFDDADKSDLSCIIVDDIERLLGMSEILKKIHVYM